MQGNFFMRSGWRPAVATGDEFLNDCETHPFFDARDKMAPTRLYAAEGPSV